MSQPVNFRFPTDGCFSINIKRPFVVSSVSNVKTEYALTRAATVNNGIYKFQLAYASRTFDADDVASRANRVYALMAQNGVSTEYQIKIKEENKTTGLVFDYEDEIDDEGERVIDLEDCIKDANHAVDYYFEIADETKAAAIGAELNGSILTATKETGDDPLEITVHYLLIDGKKYDGKIEATFKYIAPTGTLDAVSWTVTNKTDKASRYTIYRALGDLQASLVGASDTDLPELSVVGWSWTDGKGLDTKTVKRNGVKYGKDQAAARKFASHEASWISDIETEFYYINDSGSYTRVTRGTTKIQKPLYVKFTFNYTEAFPGEYVVTLGFKKGTNNTANNDYEVPVNVTIVDPLKAIVKLDNYFSGNSAVVYGEGNSANVTYDLLGLFETKDNMVFEEAEVLDSDGDPRASWLSGSVISPKVYDYDATANGKLDRIYTTRTYTAYHTPWGNDHIEATAYEFDVTVKSPIYEGSFTSQATQTIDSNTAKHFSVNDFAGVDVYGNKFYVGNVYKYDSKNGIYTSDVVEGTGMNTKYIKSVAVSGDTNAKQYLTFDTAFTKHSDFGAADAFKVARKTDLPQLQSDVTCTLTVTVLDNWGMMSQATVTVVVKAFGN